MINYSTISIKSSITNYKVIFTKINKLETWIPKGDFLLIDNFFKGKISLKDTSRVFWINSSEEEKSFVKFNKIFIAMKEANIHRGSLVTAIGGGVVQDIATFVSSLYMRGIKWNYIPTTFLGMTDSCLGGKSSINVDKYKNLVGNFHPPNQIEIIPDFIKTLPQTELFAGLAESAKICFCRGNLYFKRYLELSNPFLEQKWVNKDIFNLVYFTLEIKKWFIEKDEFDKAERKLLNYGHTWGHALETATSFLIPHGLAVGIGMMASIKFKNLSSSESDLWQHCLSIVLPFIDKAVIKEFKEDLFLSAFEADKKHSNNNYHLILPVNQKDDLLGVEELKLKKTSESLNEILNAIKNTLNNIEKILPE